MPRRELVEIELPVIDSPGTPEHGKSVIHNLAYVSDERGYVKFRERTTGKFYFQGQGPVAGHAVWFAEKEE
jgi:hypothetical protein